MFACHADISTPDLVTGGALGLALGSADGFRSLGNIYHRALVHPLGWFDAHANDADVIFAAKFTDQGADFGCAYINTNDDSLFGTHCSPSVYSLQFTVISLW